MPVHDIVITRGEEPIEVRLHYLDVHMGPLWRRDVLSYLHLVRCDPGLVPDLAGREAAYLAGLEQWVEEARALLRGVEVDLVIRPPSSRNDADPYLAAILRDHPGATDGSPYLERASEVRAGRDPTVEALMGSWRLQDTAGLESFSDLLVVDDVFSRGTTVAAVVRVLRDAGLRAAVPVNVFVPLWVQKPTKIPLEGFEPFGQAPGRGSGTR